MKTQYDYNLGRIYEMVINSDPCYAFLLEGNSLTQNKLIMAHVLAHCDFFKNNYYFKKTSRDMIESMAAAASRFREYEFKYGRHEVERFIDAAISIQEHVETRAFNGKKRHNEKTARAAGIKCHTGQYETPYDDLWNLDNPKSSDENDIVRGTETAGGELEKDLLMFIIQSSKELKPWQRDVLTVIRQEMLYFWPQMETKIMNEGWATYWHLRIIREIDLDERETVDFAKMHSSIIMPSRMRINPYALGLKMFEDIEKRWNEKSDGGNSSARPDEAGRQKIFEVRATENDISFLRNYLTRELIEELDLYLYRKIGYDWRVIDKEWENVRDRLISWMTNCGYPYLVVCDGDFSKRGELYLRHEYEGSELDVFYVEKTLPLVYRLWGRPVHLETVLDNKPVLFSFNGEKAGKKFL